MGQRRQEGFDAEELGTAVDTRGTVSVEYAVVIGTLAAAISMAFTGLGGRLVDKLVNLPL